MCLFMQLKNMQCVNCEFDMIYFDSSEAMKNVIHCMGAENTDGGINVKVAMDKRVGLAPVAIAVASRHNLLA